MFPLVTIIFSGIFFLNKLLKFSVNTSIRIFYNSLSNTRYPKVHCIVKQQYEVIHIVQLIYASGLIVN